jgi:hypothetical protein
MINKEKVARWAISGLVVVIFIGIVAFIFTRPNALQIGLPAKDASSALLQDAGAVRVEAISKPSPPKTKSVVRDAGLSPKSKSSVPDAGVGARSKTFAPDGGVKSQLYSRRD